MARTPPVIDLHTHSTVSDGTETPTELVAAAAVAGVDVLAITDHDTVAGWAEAAEAARVHGVTLVRGIEISCAWRHSSIHLLGYLTDADDGPLAAELARARDSRVHAAGADGRAHGGGRHTPGVRRGARPGGPRRDPGAAPHRGRPHRQRHDQPPGRGVPVVARQRLALLRRPLRARPRPGRRARAGGRWRARDRPPVHPDPYGGPGRRAHRADARRGPRRARGATTATTAPRRSRMPRRSPAGSDCCSRDRATTTARASATGSPRTPRPRTCSRRSRPPRAAPPRC